MSSSTAGAASVLTGPQQREDTGVQATRPRSMSSRAAQVQPASSSCRGWGDASPTAGPSLGHLPRPLPGFQGGAWEPSLPSQVGREKTVPHCHGSWKDQGHCIDSQPLPSSCTPDHLIPNASPGKGLQTWPPCKSVTLSWTHPPSPCLTLGSGKKSLGS